MDKNDQKAGLTSHLVNKPVFYFLLGFFFLLFIMMGISCSKIMLKEKEPTILSTLPINNATNIAVSIHPQITLSMAMDSSAQTASSFSLKQGSVSVPGVVSFTGKSIIFSPTLSLTGNQVYTCSFSTPSRDADGNPIQLNFTWSFTTENAGTIDAAAPTITSVAPAENATSTPVNSKVTVNFNEAMDVSTITASNITLKQGNTVIAGAVTISGNSAVFAPAVPLTAGTVYTATVANVKDMAGNMMMGTKSWTFTTATSSGGDSTAPSVSSVLPAENATSVAVNSTITINFSEAMDAATMTSSNISVKQGSATIAGTVSCTGNTVKFTPSSALIQGVIYTVAISTNVKDLAGNMMTASKSWNFTTACGSGTQSFATMVFPIVQNKCMPCHSGSQPSGGISLTNYTQVKAIGSRLDNSSMYGKMGVNSCEQAMIKAWLAQGSLNN